MLDYNATFPVQTTAPSADYPFGGAQDIVFPNDGTGTPWKKDLINDLLGFFSKSVADAGITPSGASETAVSSDVLNALQILLLKRSELRENGGDIIQTGNRLLTDQLNGLRITRDSVALVTTDPGAGRNRDDTTDIGLVTSFQKDITATWAVGGGGAGGLPEGLSLTNDTWYRMFLVRTPAGVVDIAWDTSDTAVNFFADTQAVIAGFTDASLFRRFAWVFVDSIGQLRIFHCRENDPRTILWDDPGFHGFATTDTNRTAVLLTDDVPPSAVAHMTVRNVFASVVLLSLLMSEFWQSDLAATVERFTQRGTRQSEVMYSMQVGTDHSVFHRSQSDSSTIELTVHGFTDSGLIP